MDQELHAMSRDELAAPRSCFAVNCKDGAGRSIAWITEPDPNVATIRTYPAARRARSRTCARLQQWLERAGAPLSIGQVQDYRAEGRQ